jgi:hypothetical protein
MARRDGTEDDDILEGPQEADIPPPLIDFGFG